MKMNGSMQDWNIHWQFLSSYFCSRNYKSNFLFSQPPLSNEQLTGATSEIIRPNTTHTRGL